ncbi:MAG: winged helix-turn-helix domain-containing protein [Ferruginibacter sp.]
MLLHNICGAMRWKATSIYYTHIKNLRKKLQELDADYIKSVYGMGYKFTDS